MRPGGNFGPPYLPQEDQRIAVYGDGERKPDWSNFALVFNAGARAEERPERKPYGLEQRYRALKRKKEEAVKPEGKVKGTARRRGRPRGKKREQPEPLKQPTPVSARRRRTLTEEEEGEVVKLAADFVREHVDVQALRRKFEESHPNRKGLPDSVFRNALRRGGVNEALARGLRPEFAVGKLPENFLDRAIAERKLVSKRRSFNDGEIERLRGENELLDQEARVLDDTIAGLQALGESTVALAAALGVDPGGHA